VGQAFFRILCLVLKRKKRDHALLLHSFFFLMGKLCLSRIKKPFDTTGGKHTSPRGWKLGWVE